MANIDFNCVKCDGNFEIDAQDLVDGSEDLECPHCGSKPTKASREDFVAAIAELIVQIAAISKKFAVSLSADVEADAKAVGVDDEETDEVEEDDDDDDDDDSEEEVVEDED